MRISLLKRSLLRRLEKVVFSGNPRPLFIAGDLVPADKLKLHLGSGDVNLQGWVNIDITPKGHAHLSKEYFGLENLGDNSVSHVYMCHVLEHLSDSEISNVFQNLGRVMAPGGQILISVPDFSKLVSIYLATGDIGRIVRTVLGGQDDPFNFHKQIFDKRSLSPLLEKEGFSVEGEWDTKSVFGRSLGDWSDFLDHSPAGKIPVSLNLKARRNDM